MGLSSEKRVRTEGSSVVRSSDTGADRCVWMSSTRLGPLCSVRGDESEPPSCFSSQENAVHRSRMHVSLFRPTELINIFESFLPQLLRYPNPADPLNGEAAALLMRSPDQYTTKVKEYVKRFATEEDANNAGGKNEDEEDSDEDEDGSEGEMSDMGVSDDEAAGMDL